MLFVVSTERHAAKTSIACALLARLQHILPVPPAVVRLVETECLHDEAHDLVGRDGPRLRAAAGDHIPPLVVSPYRFTGRGPPRVAAERAGVGLTRQDLVSALVQAEDFGSMVVVDTEGGILTAMARDALLVDVCETADAHVLVVAIDDVGAENSALLAVDACARRNVKVAGIMLNQAYPRAEATEDPNDFENHRLIEAYVSTTTPVYPTVPFIAGAKDENDVISGIVAHLARHRIVESILATIAPTPERSAPGRPASSSPSSDPQTTGP
ncbi:MAG: dethiobiotin synthase [Deltaproteobacteria bacterium]|nr:dethiobiotin synthase [Deltaproteobacteria bacterium]